MKLSVYNFLFEQVEQSAKKSRFQVLKEKFVDELKKLTVEQLIQIGQADPTSQAKDQGENIKMGAYSQWILKQYLKLLPEKFDVTKAQKKDRKVELFWEDLYKLDDWLRRYDRFKHRIQDVAKRQIQNIDSIAELQKMIGGDEFEIKDKSQAAKQEKRNYELVNNVEYLYKDDKWEVVVPKTWEASKAVAGYPVTQWCTAAVNIDHHFDSYGRQGPLFILRDLSKMITKGPVVNQPKPTYQFHFETDSFMDEDDNDINVANLLRENPGLGQFFRPIFEKFLKKQSKDRGSDIMDNRIFRTFIGVYGMDEKTRKMVMELLKTKVQGSGESIEINNSSYGPYVEVFGLENFIHQLFEYADPKIGKLEILLTGQNQTVAIPETLGKFTNVELLSIENIAQSIPASIIKLKNLSLLNLSFNQTLTSLPKIPTVNLTVINITDTGIQQLDPYLQQLAEEPPGGGEAQLFVIQ